VQRGYVSTHMAHDGYHVVLDPSGAVDVEATEKQRARERELRLTCATGADVLPIGDGAGGLPEERPPVAGAGPQILGEYLAIDAEGWYRCRRCDHRVASNSTNWKWWALCAESHVEPTVIHNAIVVRRNGDLMFRRYFCPSCAVQIDSEVALTGEPPRWNFMPLGASPPVREISGDHRSDP
jgi:N-methylhydantoinase B